MRKIKKHIKRGVITAFVLALFLFASGLTAFAVLIRDLPNPADFESRRVAQSTKLYDHTGEVLLYELYGEEKRTTIPFEEIPDFVKYATVAIEDKEFYTHGGFNVLAIIKGAIIEPLLGQRDRARGGSTITQQLAKNAFLSSERTIIRKLKELVVAYELEKRYSKDEILNLYLNQVPYGGNAYGIEAAAKTFFNKSAKELNAAESALLASLPQATSYYSPWGKHADELMRRKNIVLTNMHELGYITEEEKREAQNFTYEFAPQSTAIKAPHFTLEVQEYLNKKYGEDFVRIAGLRVITTLDWDLQQVAERAIEEGAERNTELYSGHNAALVAQDATTGQIMAMVGSKNYFGDPEPEGCAPGLNCRFEGNFNVAVRGLRQPGSAMKPLGYLSAFQKGLTPETIVFDLPTEFAAQNPLCPLEVDFTNTEKSCFHPQNFDETFRGPVTLRTALSQSINVPAVKVLYLAGIDNVLQLSREFGISTLTERSRYGLSLVLGGGEVTLKEMVGAYSVFAQDGKKLPQTLILKITDSKGTVLEEYRRNETQVIDAQYVRLLNDILSDVEARSGLFSSSLPLTLFPGHQVALKTGTTNDYRDAWTIGYTPELVVGVWAGNNNNEPMHQRGSSLLAALPIWNSFMKEALQERALVPFQNPDPVLTQKPILQGNYVTNYKIGNQRYPQIHNILYFIDKNNIQGPLPTNPEQDSQFQNWEVPVLAWAARNVPDFFQSYNQPIPAGAEIDLLVMNFSPSLEFITPHNGQFITGNEFDVHVQFIGITTAGVARAYFNGALVNEQVYSENYVQSLPEIRYIFRVTPSSFELQNLLKVEFIDARGNTLTKEIILFK